MPETVVEQNPVILAVIAQLESDLAFSVGDGQAPKNPSPEFPYVTVYSLDDAEYAGPMSDGQADVIHNVQLTHTGQTPEQARRLTDFARASMQNLVAADPIAGRSTQLVEFDSSGLIERDDEIQPPFFYAVDIYRITTTPA